MIQKLRTRHRRMTLALLVVLPVGWLVGMAGRQATPFTAELPEGAKDSVAAFSEERWSEVDLFPQHGPDRVGMRVELLAETAPGRRLALVLGAQREYFVNAPQPPADVLVYWWPGAGTGEAGATAELPKEARLLGALAWEHLTVLPLAADVAGAQGRLLLYGFVDHKVLAVSKTFTAGGTKP